MPRKEEIEIKFRITNIESLESQLRANGFRCVTPSTHEYNTLYDLPGQVLRQRGEILRLRKYGENWILTHKGKGAAGPHKSRVETETAVTDGEALSRILQSLGFTPAFIYEKFRAEWTDGTGDVVVDQTPVGDIAEIEGPSDWIDATARSLAVRPSDYLTSTYADLFYEWKRSTQSTAESMTYAAIGKPAPFVD
jgi:adenylate cyclase, class 2